MSGADTVFATFEAEQSTTNAEVVRVTALALPNTAAPELEASGRAFVRIDEPGEFCELAATAPGNALVVRYCIADSESGGGTQATLSLYINGRFVRKLALDSRYNWLYGEASDPHGGHSNKPHAGPAHVFWNDTRFLLADGAWRAGDRLRLQKDEGDSATYYGLDLVDLELAPPPSAPPTDDVYLSIVDFGATADDDQDDTDAIRRCVAAAKEREAGVWIPTGQFRVRDTVLLDGVRVQGAGMWHTELVGSGHSLGFVLLGDGPRVADLSIESQAHHSRHDRGGMAFRSRGAENWSVERVWITHVHCGFWMSGASHGLVRGCRIYDTYADALNLNGGSSHNLVEQNYIRGAGDDGVATLDLQQDKRASVKNTIRRNTVIANWWGHNIDVAGGSGHLVEENYLADNSHSGCLALNHPPAYPMRPLTSARIEGNSIVRGGGNHAGQRRGAVWSFAGDSPITGVLFRNNRIVDPIFCALHLHGGARQEIVFADNWIEHPGGDVVRVDESVTGQLEFRDNTVRELRSDARLLDNAAGPGFEFIDVGTLVE